MIRFLLNLDRRIIFMAVALAILIPLIFPLNIPILKASVPTKRIYKKIDTMKEGSVLFISFDFDPASAPELMPMAEAILRHAFSRNIRVIATGLWVTGIGLAEKAVREAAQEYNKKMGEDWVFLGWKPGAYIVIIGLGQDICVTFPKDHFGNETKDLPLLKEIKSLKEIDYLVDLAAGSPGIETWVQFGQTVHRFEMGAGCTGVIAPGAYPYYQAGQLNGILCGFKGAAEYEHLLRVRGFASTCMDSLSVAHFILIFFIIMCNILYFASRKKEGK